MISTSFYEYELIITRGSSVVKVMVFLKKLKPFLIPLLTLYFYFLAKFFKISYVIG
jgi:hypothetical protein